MKPKELPRTTQQFESFSVKKHKLPYFLNIWHYHEEIELVLIVKSTGTRFIGDNIEPFGPGDLILIGSQLPHLWLNDKIYFKNSGLGAEALVIHFHPLCLGDIFFNIPEMNKIKSLFKDAQRGLKIMGPHKTELNRLIQDIFIESDTEKIILILKILLMISKNSNIPLASHAFIKNFKKDPNSRLDKVYEYVFNNFKEEITLNTISGFVNMNPSAFSRFFSQMVNKTFIEFLNEIRIGYACRLFLDTLGKNISEIAFECGFNSVSNFNKQFKNVTGKSPRSFMGAYSNNGTSKIRR